METRVAGPLQGVKVVDLSAVVSGPMATQILADQGADVIKVEPIGIGDVARYLGPTSGGISSMFATTNRNKRSLALNLKDKRGLEIVTALARGADVFVQNFRPGAIGRMGLGYDTLKAVNPGLVYISMSGFGQTGPYAKRRVYDPVVQVVSGFADAQADSKTGEPRLIQQIVCDKVTALTAAQAITAALFAKSRSGQGQHIALNMLDAVIAFLWSDAFYNDIFLAKDARDAPDLSQFYAIYPTKDGYITTIALSDDEFGDLMRALGRNDVAANPLYKTVFDRLQHAGELRAIIAAEFAKWTNAELLPILNKEDVPHAPVNRRSEVAGDPQVQHNATLIDLTHPKAGPLRDARPAPEFASTPASIRSPAPMLGEHTDAILRELGRTDADIASLRSDKIVA